MNAVFMQVDELEKIIDRYLAGQASEQEKEFIEHYWSSQPGNDIVITTDERLRLAEEIWSAIVLKSDVPSGNQVTRVRNISPWFKSTSFLRYAVAAFFIAVFGISGWYYLSSANKSAPPAEFTSVKAGASRKVTDYLLPDSSVLHLFPGSVVMIPDDYNTNDRKLNVNGKVFFEVRRNPLKPFHVLTGTLQTTVLGTSFEVNTFSRDNPAITVRTGKVGVSYKGKRLAQLGVNDQLHVLLPSGEMKLDKVNAAVLCNWWNGTFSFEQSPLPEVLENIGKWHGVAITIKNSRWNSELVTIQLKSTMSLVEMMSLLSETLDFSYQVKGQQMLIF